MRKHSLIIFFGLLTSLSFCQVTPEKPPMKLIMSPGLIYQGQFLGELNLMLSRLDMTAGGSAIWGPRIGLESSFRSDNYMIAPKIGYEFSGLLFCLRANALSYFQNGDIDLRILPEIGLSLSGAMNLCYGYNIHIYKDKINDVSNHRISLTINMDFDLWKGL